MQPLGARPSAPPCVRHWNPTGHFEKSYRPVPGFTSTVLLTQHQRRTWWMSWATRRLTSCRPSRCRAGRCSLLATTARMPNSRSFPPSSPAASDSTTTSSPCITSRCRAKVRAKRKLFCRTGSGRPASETRAPASRTRKNFADGRSIIFATFAMLIRPDQTTTRRGTSLIFATAVQLAVYIGLDTTDDVTSWSQRQGRNYRPRRPPQCGGAKGQGALCRWEKVILALGRKMSPAGAIWRFLQGVGA